MTELARLRNGGVFLSRSAKRGYANRTAAARANVGEALCCWAYFTLAIRLVPKPFWHLDSATSLSLKCLSERSQTTYSTEKNVFFGSETP
jgi:hypothetical protein